MSSIYYILYHFRFANINPTRFTPEFKVQVVLEMFTKHKSAAQLSREHRIKDSVISRWKQELIERSLTLSKNGSTEKNDRAQHIAEQEQLVGLYNVSI